MKSFGLAAIACLALASGAKGAEIKIAEVKAYLFLEHAGKLSDNVIGAADIVNAPKGGAPGGDAATGVLIDFTFSGERNSTPKYAAATVELTQAGPKGQQIVTHKAFANFIFGADGLQHKALFVEGATCMPMTIDVRAGKSQKAAKIGFSCGE